MAPALIKLESFTAALPGKRHERSYTRDDLDLAYADGLAEGRAQRREEELHSLHCSLERMAVALAEDDARRAELRDEAVAALAPVLSEILDSLAPSARSRKLEQALLDELRRLSSMSAPLRCRITCPPGLHDMVQRCLRETGLDTITPEQGDGNRINLSLEGGRIEFQPERMAQDIRALIAEITEREEKWTH